VSHGLNTAGMNPGPSFRPTRRVENRVLTLAASIETGITKRDFEPDTSASVISVTFSPGRVLKIAYTT